MARPKKRKYPRLPNKFGSIKKLSGNRTNPYGVYPPTTEFDADGRPKSVPALAYVDDWYYGFSILTAYHAGTYVPGVYPPKPAPKITATDQQDTVVLDIIRDYGKIRSVVTGKPDEVSELTFTDVYQRFFKSKFLESKKKYSKSSEMSTAAAFKNCAVLHKRIFQELRHGDLQGVLDSCPLKHASLELILSLFRQMYAYADMEGICDKDYSAHVKINVEDDDEGGEPFTEDELKILWKQEKNPAIEMALIMCYSGYRISAYKTLKVDLKDQYFLGGVKTKAGKNRVVPIHPGILPLVKRRIRRDGGVLVCSTVKYRADLYAALDHIGVKRHTPHDCRHTFSALCEKYGVQENDRKRMLGHSFGADITNSTYGHRSVDDLRVEICKIRICR
ncbi:tyrosine-type recombinase/integrase [Enterocloster lavalensis]|uniref:tyrosine-type recombinase/integrase n=1 Tax=Enterocloster lavalensis TaxID=460384 RepID=UPI000D19E04F|nr:tyrosine-type recombinase/integrase [Enterocloster lavalensis]PST31365.1 integrase [Enterocloster lavalensis]